MKINVFRKEVREVTDREKQTAIEKKQSVEELLNINLTDKTIFICITYKGLKGTEKEE